MAETRQVRIYLFSNWADSVEDAMVYLQSERDVAGKVTDPGNSELLKMARLDRDWDAESIRALASISSFELRFLPMRVFGRKGLLELYQDEARPSEDRWLLFAGMMRLQELSDVIGKFFRRFAALGCKIFFWSYDQASHRMPIYAADIAPNLSVLVHDETPLHSQAEAALSPRCARLHRSWVANMIPFAQPFHAQPERKIVFLGSKMGVTDQRRQAIETLANHFKDAFIAVTDHSVPIRERGHIGRYKVHLCPEGRHFTGFPMRWTHTDRAFWAGCLGQVPVIEDSQWGGRLGDLVSQGLVWAYPHGDLSAMIQACEAALEAPNSLRQAIYQHFNAHETIGRVVEGMIARYYRGLGAGAF